MSHDKKLCSTDLQIVLRTAYEETFGIVEHSALSQLPEENAFALVTLNDNENIYKDDMQRARAKRFAVNRVAHHFGISYKDFIELPRSTCDMLFEVTEELIAEEAPLLKDLEKEFTK